MRYLCFIFIVFSIAACATKELTTLGQKVKVAKAEPTKDCTEIAQVSANNQDAEVRNALLKNRAAEKGANYVRLDAVTNFGEYTGTAFKCPQE